MKIFTTVAAISRQSEAWRRKGFRIGFVPTLGFLHRGHLALLRRARKENDRVVLSIYLNPDQFRKPQFNRYPRDLDRDAALAREAGADAVFAPSVREMSPDGSSTRVEVPDLAGKMDGKPIRWHFRAVTTVVLKLFSAVKPHTAYFGKKDAQQLVLIRKMVQDLLLGIRIVPVETVRDRNGLALSSRNSLLTKEEKRAARVIPKTLAELERLVKKKRVRSSKTLLRSARGLIAKEPLARLLALEIVSARTLDPLPLLQGDVLLHLAVMIGGIRLMDNRTLRVAP